MSNNSASTDNSQVSCTLLDKHRPSSIEEIIHNDELKEHIISLSKITDIPHLILYGPSQSGKKTFINMFLKEKYGKNSQNLKSNTLELNNTSKTTFKYSSSNYHFYVTMKDYNVYDRHIIQNLIKEISKTKNFFSNYHTIVIDRAEKLNNDAQQSLLRTMEKYAKNCRIILIVNSDYNLIEPLASRCIQLRLKKPTKTQIMQILKTITTKENFTLQQDILEKIPSLCDNKISKSINFLEFIMVKNVKIKDLNTVYYEFDIVKKSIDNLIEMLFNNNELNFLNEANNMLNDTIIHSTDPNELFKKIYLTILSHEKFDKNKIKKLVFITDENYNKLSGHNKPIYHFMDYYIKCFECIKL